MSSSASQSSSNNNNNNNANEPNHTKGTIVGECKESTRRYSHDYIHCDFCNIPQDKVSQCSIKDCPCNGQGILFEVECEPGKSKNYVHQLPWHHESVRVCLQRPAEAIQRITTRLAKLATNQAAAIAAAAIVQEDLPTMRQKRDRDDDEEDEESKTKHQKINHSHLSDDDNENKVEPFASIDLEISGADLNSLDDPDDPNGGIDNDVDFHRSFDA